MTSIKGQLVPIQSFANQQSPGKFCLLHDYVMTLDDVDAVTTPIIISTPWSDSSNIEKSRSIWEIDYKKKKRISIHISKNLRSPARHIIPIIPLVIYAIIEIWNLNKLYTNTAEFNYSTTSRKVTHFLCPKTFMNWGTYGFLIIRVMPI